MPFNLFIRKNHLYITLKCLARSKNIETLTLTLIESWILLQKARDQTGLNKNMYKQNAVSNVTD